MKYVFIINPMAGAEDAPKRLLPKIDAYFNEHGLEKTILLTEYNGHAKKLAAEVAMKGEPVRICACGGDGTLNEVVSGIVGYDNVEVGVLPCGSGNDFIKCFGTKDDFSNIDSFVNGDAKSLDIMKINDDRYCLNIFSVGVDADVAAGIPKWRRVPLCGGHTAYNLSLVEAMLKPIGKKLNVNGKPGNFSIVTICNGQVYGGGYIAAPIASPDDGVMELIKVVKISKLKLAGVISVYKAGQHFSGEEVSDSVKDIFEFERTTRVRISAEEPFAANVDGEIIPMTSADVCLLPKAYKFVVPVKQ